MLESKKLSNEVISSSIEVISFPKLSKRSPDFMNNHQLERFYNLAKKNTKSISLKNFCNQVIHSFIFLPEFSSNDQVNGFFLVSDKEKGNKLLLIQLKHIIKTFKSIGNDYVISSHKTRDLYTGEWKVQNSIKLE